MKPFVMLIFIILPFANSAQNSFVIKGYGKGFRTGDQIFLSYRGKSGFIEDSTLVRKGSFKFEGKIHAPVKANLYRNQNPKYADIIYDAATVYLETGEIRLNSADTLYNSINSGQPLNNDYALLLKSIKPCLDQLILTKLPVDLAHQDQINETVVSLKFKFIKEHPRSFVSLQTLSELIRDSKWLHDAAPYFDLLSNELKGSDLGKSVKAKILLEKKITIGMKIKDFELPDINGVPIRLSNYRGHYVLIDFWASWCGPCRSENPNVLAAYNKFKDKGFMVLGISIDDHKDRDKWLTAIEEDGLVWPQLSDHQGNENISKNIYGITSIPANILIAPDGTVIAKNLKRDELQAKLNGLYQ